MSQAEKLNKAQPEHHSRAAFAAPGAPPKTRPRLWPLAVLFAVQGVFISLIYLLALRYAPPGRLVPIDAIALPGAQAALGVRLERENPPVVGARLSGAKVVFEGTSDGNAAGAKPAGSAVTNAEGVATCTVQAPDSPGLYRFRARLEPPGGVPLEKPEVEVLLDVMPAQSQLLIVLSQALTSQDLPAKGIQDQAAAPLPALPVLRDLSREWRVLYLATQKSEAPTRLRPWLEGHEFPPGPTILTLPEGDWMKLSSFVSSLGLSQWKGEHWGVCTYRKDAMALERAGLRVVILEAAGENASIGKTFSAANWTDAKKIIEGKN